MRVTTRALVMRPHRKAAGEFHQLDVRFSMGLLRIRPTLTVGGGNDGVIVVVTNNNSD